MDAIMIGQILQTYAMNTKASECKGPEICVRKVMQELETSKQIINNNEQ